MNNNRPWYRSENQPAVITFRCSKEFHEQLLKLANAKGQSLNTTVSDACKRYVEQENSVVSNA